MELDNELFKAIKADNLEKVKTLIQNGADVNVKDKWGRTPLDIVIEKNYEDTVKLLKQHGAK